MEEEIHKIEISNDTFSAPKLEMDKGMLLFEMGNLNGALAFFESLAKQYPDDLYVKFLRALTLPENGQQSNILSILNELSENAPENLEFHRLRAFVLIRLNRRDDALDVIKKASDQATDRISKKIIEFYTAVLTGDNLGALVRYKDLHDMNAIEIDIKLLAIACMAQEADYISLLNTVDHLGVGSPYDKGLLYLQGIGKLGRGDFHGARDDIAAALDSIQGRLRSEEFARAQYLLGYCEGKLNDYAKAIYRYSRAIQSNPKMPEPFFERASIRLLTDDPQNAIDDFLISIKLEYAVIPSLIKIGHAYLGLIEADKAKEYFLKAVERDPQNLEGHWGLGLCHHMGMNYSESRREFNVCIALDGNYSPAWAYLAFLDSTEGLIEEATMKVKKAEELGESSGLTELTKGILAYWDGRYAQSIKLCSEALTRNADLAVAYQFRAASKMQLYDSSALADIRAAFNTFPDAAIGSIDGALALNIEKRYDESEQLLSEAIDLNRKRKNSGGYSGMLHELLNATLYEMRSDVRIQQKKYRAALSDICVVLEQKPKSSDVFLKKAQLLCRLGKYQEAVKEIYSILKINPQCAHAHLLLGEIEYLEKKKKGDRGMNHFHTAIKFDSGLGEAYYYLGKIYSEKKNHTAAMTAFEKADELGYREETEELNASQNIPKPNNVVVDETGKRKKVSVDYVTIYIDAIKELKTGSFTFKELEEVTSVSDSKWSRLFQDPIFYKRVKDGLHSRQSGKYSKTEATKQFWINAEASIDSMIEDYLGKRDFWRETPYNPHGREQGTQIHPQMNDSELNELFEEETNRSSNIRKRSSSNYDDKQ